MPIRKLKTPRARRARVHGVTANLSLAELVKAGSALTLVIVANGERVGTLRIGRGSIVWRGRRRKTEKRMGWTKFVETMDGLAYHSHR
jgi:hypothetical protein